MSKKLLPATIKALLETIMVPVKSSNILSLGYHETTKALIVNFVSGDIWAYMAVDKSDYESMIHGHCPSVGKYFNEKVKHDPSISQFKLS